MGKMKIGGEAIFVNFETSIINIKYQ